MIGDLSGALASASAQGVAISGLPSWVIPTMAIAVVVAAVIAGIVSARSNDGKSVLYPFLFAGLTLCVSIMVCVFLTGAVITGISESNIAKLEKCYGVSDVRFIESKDGESRTARLSLVSSDGGSTTGAFDDAGTSLIPLDSPSDGRVSFRDAKGIIRNGYLIISGDRVRLYLDGGSVNRSGVATVVEYGRTAAKSATKTTTADTFYDYGSHR